MKRGNCHGEIHQHIFSTVQVTVITYWSAGTSGILKDDVEIHNNSFAMALIEVGATTRYFAKVHRELDGKTR